MDHQLLALLAPLPAELGVADRHHLMERLAGEVVASAALLQEVGRERVPRSGVIELRPAEQPPGGVGVGHGLDVEDETVAPHQF